MRQLEDLIAKFDAQDRAELAAAFGTFVRVIHRYGRPNVTRGALLQFLGSLAIANASDDLDRFKVRLVAKAAQTGPNVTALFQAL